MKENRPFQIDQRRLVTLFKDIKRLNSDETRFCFLIGAGASKSSGIKTGWELSEEWYKSLKEDLSQEELKEWEESIGFNVENIGAFYPHLYKKRYETSVQIGYEEFKKLMENIEPGIGYVILSQIIANERHNFVITTNFDYLIEDSVRMYTQKKPFSAGHETLAEFISSQTERPTIIKVHRDLFLHPFNNDNETQKLKEEWKNALIPILRNFNLLVIGYGGNDGSLMDYLSSIESQNRKAIYWCIRNDNEINSKINNLLGEKDFLVKIKGFDELMISLNDVLEYKVFENLDEPEKHPFVKAAKKRLNDLNKKLKDLLDKLPKDSQSVDNETKELFTGVMKCLFNAHFEKDVNKKNEIYEKGLNEYPNDTELIGEYAVFLSDILKDYDKAEVYYKKAIELQPDGAAHIGNYAIFLNDNRKDYDKAEEYYKKAIKLKPDDATYNGNYAIFLKDNRKDYDKAEEYYKKAIELKPDEVAYFDNYAIFLSDIRKDYNKAEEYYKKAIDLQPDDAAHIGNYALFLNDNRKDYDKAEEYYKKAIELKSDDADLIGNYAIFLKNIRKDYDKAEEYYKKAIELKPDDANKIGNYALLLSNIRKDYDKAEEYYKKAIELKPDEVAYIGNYAIFLSNIRKDYDKAEEYYKKAIELQPDDAAHIGNYAVFLNDNRKDYDKAEEYYKKAIELQPDSATYNGNYAVFLNDNRKDYDKAEEYYKKAIELQPDSAALIGNYALFLKNIRKDYDKAEEYYKKAIELEPANANYICNYAIFLSDIRKDFNKAEEYYKKAIDLEPENANNICNYAHHLIISKHDFKNAEKYIDHAFLKVGIDNESLSVKAELWFYRYAHYKKWYEEGEQALAKLTTMGAKSIGWNFDEHIEIAKKNNHPNIQKLQHFSDLITK